MKTLEETKQLDNTLVVFTSDNGYLWGERHLGDKRWAYEESLRNSYVNVDIEPTMLALGGASAPAEVQGRSITTLFRLADFVSLRVFRRVRSRSALPAGRRYATRRGNASTTPGSKAWMSCK